VAGPVRKDGHRLGALWVSCSKRDLAREAVVEPPCLAPGAAKLPEATPLLVVHGKSLDSEVSWLHG